MEVTGGKNIMAVLEGGYNQNSISWAAESVLRALIGENDPHESKIDLQQMKDTAQPNVVGFNAVRKCLNKYQILYPFLENFQNDYDRQMIQNVNKSLQIYADDEQKYIIKEGFIFKNSKQNKLVFY